MAVEVIVQDQDQDTESDPFIESLFANTAFIDVYESAFEDGSAPQKRKSKFSKLKEDFLFGELTYSQSVRYLGAMLPLLPMGSVAIIAIVSILLLSPSPIEFITIIYALFWIGSTALTTYIGFSLGKKVADAVPKQPLILRLVVSVFVGFIWGAISGGVGGLLLFGYGAFVGTVIGMFAGTFSLPVFTLLFHLLEEDGKIRSSRFLPIATGLSLLSPALLFWLTLLIYGE